jgi:hypothetical protein
LVIVSWRWPVGVLLLAERRLRRWPVIWFRRRAIVGLRRRAIVSISDTDRRPVVEPGSRTGFVGEPSRRRRDHKRREHSLWDHIARTRRYEVRGRADK